MYIVIVANLPDLDLTPYLSHIRQADLLIAADGGANALLRHQLVPQIVVGDLDSLDPANQALLAAQGTSLRRFPRDKDETDLELALMLACEHKPERIDLLGVLGGRWDHTLANVALLSLPILDQIQVRCLADQQELFLVKQRATIVGHHGDTVSLIPLTPIVTGVTTHGLRYALDDATLHFEQARGVSNTLFESPGHVRIGSGLLLIVHHFDDGAHQWRMVESQAEENTHDQ
jgi:thiamine pyrophosphokinase